MTTCYQIFYTYTHDGACGPSFGLRFATPLQHDVLGRLSTAGFDIPGGGLVSDSGLGAALTAADTVCHHLLLLGRPPMKLLLGEMLSPAIARELRARGHDAAAVAGNPEREALSDPEVLALARAEHRALVTNNPRDFRPLHHEAITPGGAGHHGMIFIPGNYRRTRADTGKIITALEAILTQHPGEDDLANAETWL